MVRRTLGHDGTQAHQRTEDQRSHEALDRGVQRCKPRRHLIDGAGLDADVMKRHESHGDKLLNRLFMLSRRPAKQKQKQNATHSWQKERNKVAGHQQQRHGKGESP